MKKALIVLALCALLISCATTNIDNDRYIVSVYAKESAQPYKGYDNLDTIWVYYSDDTFEQYAELDDDIVLFSTGTYELIDGDDFYFEEGEPMDIIISRNQKYQNGALSEYSSEHTYDLGTLGFEQLYGYSNEEGRIAEAIFYGLDKQPYLDESGEKDMLDTCWIYYSDDTFEQYAEVDDDIVLFSAGTYELENGGDFIYCADKPDYGDIVINRNRKYIAGQGLVSYESSHRYDLNSLGFDEIALSAY